MLTSKKSSQEIKFHSLSSYVVQQPQKAAFFEDKAAGTTKWKILILKFFELL